MLLQHRGCRGYKPLPGVKGAEPPSFLHLPPSGGGMGGVPFVLRLPPSGGGGALLPEAGFLGSGDSGAGGGDQCAGFGFAFALFIGRI